MIFPKTSLEKVLLSPYPQEMNTKFKERTRFRATTSAVDHRPSATYVGTVAVAVVLTIFGSVIVFDIVTFTASCTDKCRKRRKARKARKYRKKNATLGNSVEVPVDILARSKRLNEMRWPGSPNCDDDTPGPAQDEDWTNFSSPSSEHQQPLSQSIRSSAPTTSLNDVELMLETDASAQQILTYHRRGNSMHQPITERSGISKHVRCFSLPSGKEILDRKWHEPRTVAFQLSDDSGIDYHLSFERDDIFDTTALSHYRNDVITPTQTTGSLDTANKYVMAYGHNFEGRNLY
ncbi:uncharacterized protein LOC101863335 [Aplysia californica]|uniref:Uncharacterized protein LOC101863335 n=1 Tax=Aplysia californica TaxID=6500 RepID=A0ABM0JK22_APLCA|nr:uncharacterized protein LOC101863335 [Aplysia californica]